MDLLKAELEKRKKQSNGLRVNASAATKDGKKKYVRRGDYRKAQEEKEQEEKKVREAAKRKARGESIDDGQDAKKAKTTEEVVPAIPFVVVKRRLRKIGSVVTYFGETVELRVKRLLKEEKDFAEGRTEEFHLGAGYEGIKNTFLQQDQLLGGQETKDEDDEEEGEDFFDKEEKEAEEGGEGGGALGDTPTVVTSDPVNAPITKGASPRPAKEMDPHKRIYKFFRGLLKQWEAQLAARPEQLKLSTQGKIATKTQKQCKDYIRPLFKRCKQRSLEPDICKGVMKMVKFCEVDKYVQANDEYITLAIGNAAWPIGVTMVGIHERSGREKINSQKVAHVMNDEAQRKYLTSVKRLMTWKQNNSDANPSQKVM
jgi:pre-mRNA-splicing factor 18